MKDKNFDIMVNILRLPHEIQGIDKMPCPACGFPLRVHQPEITIPHRLLATCTCEEFGVWYCLIVKPDGASFSMIRLPSVVELVEQAQRCDQAAV